MKFTKLNPILFFCSFIIISFTSCNNFQHSNNNSLNVEVPINLNEIINSRSVEDDSITDNDIFNIKATISGDIQQTHFKNVSSNNKTIKLKFSKYSI